MKKIKIISLLISLGLIITSQNIALASDNGLVYFSASKTQPNTDDTFVVDVNLSSPQQTINTASGSLFFNKDILQVSDISVGDSIFNLWAEAPKFINQSGMINFVGGSTKGFKGQKAVMIKIIFTAKKPGVAEIGFNKNFSLFLADGKGTRIIPATEPFSISVGERQQNISPVNDWQNLTKNDQTPPETFEVLLSHNPSLFDNKFFISFGTTDTGSGIDYYQVKEGSDPYITATSPYQIKNQSIAKDILVKAVDKAGNETVAKFVPLNEVENNKEKILSGIIGLIAILAFACFIHRLRKRRKNNNYSSWPTRRKEKKQ
jgi:hypothetical protein